MKNIWKLNLQFREMLNRWSMQHWTWKIIKFDVDGTVGSYFVENTVHRRTHCAVCIIKTIFNFMLCWSLFGIRWPLIVQFVCAPFSILKKEIELTSVWPTTATMWLWPSTHYPPTPMAGWCDAQQNFERSIFLRKLKEETLSGRTWNLVVSSSVGGRRYSKIESCKMLTANAPLIFNFYKTFLRGRCFHVSIHSFCSVCREFCLFSN